MPMSWCGRMASTNAIGRDRARGAEIGRAEDRYVGDGPGVFDQVADAHDVAADGDARHERRQRRRRRLRRGRREPSRAASGDRQSGMARIMARVMAMTFRHFISCEVVCSISSAAVMTLEFIS